MNLQKCKRVGIFLKAAIYLRNSHYKNKPLGYCTFAVNGVNCGDIKGLEHMIAINKKLLSELLRR